VQRLPDDEPAQGIIPGAEHWPQFRATPASSSKPAPRCWKWWIAVDLLRGMAGSRLPVAVAHGEGRAEFDNAVDQAAARVSLRYVDGTATLPASTR
jgi:phosphoribosylformylglycinamidine synthase